jgi:hypothetical protein
MTSSTSYFPLFTADNKFHTGIFSELKRWLAMRDRFEHDSLLSPKIVGKHQKQVI